MKKVYQNSANLKEIVIIEVMIRLERIDKFYPEVEKTLV